MRTVVIIQARMSSSRLPGKVLADIAGMPSIVFMVERVRRAKASDQIVVATSLDASDDPLASALRDHGVACIRGSLDDVLERFALAAEITGADRIIRLTGDCPLIDPSVIDAVAGLVGANCDYASNVDPPTFPDGLDVEAFTRAALGAARDRARQGSDREHVTPWMRRAESGLRCKVFRAPTDLSALRWTVDYPDDLDRVRSMIAELPGSPFEADYRDFLRLVSAGQNAGAPHHDRNEGYAKSVLSDEEQTGQGSGVAGSYRRFDASEAMLERAQRVIPLGSQTFSKSRTHWPVGVSPLYLERGDGSRVWDVDGNEYVDFVNSLCALTLGYRDPDVDAAVRAQLEGGVILSLPHRLEAEVAERICEMVPCAEMVRFGKNGSDATAGAVRVARAFTGRDHVAVCGYHGWQDWYIGSTARHLGVPDATRALTHSFLYNDISSLHAVFAAHPGSVAAVILEPMNIDWPAPGFLEEVKALAAREGALLIFDETITGFRFANGGAQQLFGVTPDLSCFGKGLANGHPVSAVAGRRDVMMLMEEIFFSFTFGGELLSLAAAKAVLDKLQREPVLDSIAARGDTLMQRLGQIIERNGLGTVFGVKGHPSWSFLTVTGTPGVDVFETKTLLMQELHQRGILSVGTHNISFAHDDADIDRLIVAYEHILPMIGEAVAAGDVVNRLRCAPLAPLFKVR